MKFSIRNVREEDAESIVSLLNPIIQQGSFTIMDTPASIEEQINFIRAFPKRGLYLAALDNNNQKVLGIQDVQPLAATGSPFHHVGEVSTFVSLDAQRKGIGTKLFQATFHASKELGYKKLRATVRADNPNAVSFYQSQGFKTIGTAEKHALVRGTYIDEILMEKLIT